jgi:hypothetical protein
MSYFLESNRPRVSDMEYHLAGVKEKLPPTQLFEDYALWEERLWQLKAHLDGQKYGGIRRLWPRNASWGFVQGILTIVLVSLVLVVLIVETVETYRGL